MDRTILSPEEWRAEAVRRFGPCALDWVFQCILCGRLQTGREFQEHFAISAREALARAHMSCIGRWLPGTGCDWTLGGLLQIHTHEVLLEGELIPVFAFPPETPEEGTPHSKEKEVSL
jgi:hypothetical protein